MSNLHQNLRKWHRRFGGALALLIILQAGSGAVISLVDLSHSHSVAHAGQKAAKATEAAKPDSDPGFMHYMAAIHLGGGSWAKVYRGLLGIFLCIMASSGLAIFFKVGLKKKI